VFHYCETRTLTITNGTVWDCALYVTLTLTDPNTGIGSPEYEQNLTCEDERLLCGQNSLKVLLDIRDNEASVSNCIETVTPSMSSVTFQGVVPEEVMFNSWYSSVAPSWTLLTGLGGFLVILFCLLQHIYFL